MDLALFTSSKKADECAAIEAAVKAVARKFRGRLHASILDIEQKANRDAAAQFQIFSAPGLVLNGERIFGDRVPSEEELSGLIEKTLSEQAPSRKREGGRYWSISGLPEQWQSEY
ncbi:MAG: hypothetical protein PHF51_01250 [Candidatus ainarchaeum sp.]|nr:hypothetical protein [Candidatus ainarchaeum sp.]